MEFYDNRDDKKEFRGEEVELCINDKFYFFRSNIKKIIFSEDIFYILISKGEEGQRNIFCINSNGTFKWQVSSSKYDFSPRKYYKHGSYYKNIFLDEKKLIALNIGDFNIEIDIYTGKVLNEQIAR